MNLAVKLMRVAVLFAISTVAASTLVNAKDADLEGKVMPDGKPIICKKVQETGSLVRRSKKCYTRVQWDRISEAAKANATRMQSDHAAGMVSN